MAMVKRAGTKKRLVLDIGSSAVRLCELSQTKAGYQLTRYLQREYVIEPGASEETRRERTVAALNELLKESKNRTKKTLFAVPGQSVFTRTRALPPVPSHKVSQIVRYEIQQQIPFSLDQIALDFQVLSRTDAGGYDVLMAAIKVDVVEKRLDLLSAIKRAVDTVDVAPVAAYNWLKYTGEFGTAGECVALLDLGAATTDIVIEREGQFRFTRSLNLGGNDITAAVSTAFGLEFAEAEKLKRERGFAPTGDPQRDGRGGEVIGQVLNRLVSEINRSFAYFRSQPGGGSVSRVIITGGGACLRNIIPFLQRQLGLEVRIAQPLAGLAIAPGAQEVNEHPEQAAVALGLALRVAGEVPINLNLIPPRILEQARRRQEYVYWASSLAVLLLIFASIIPDTQNRIRAVEQQIDMTKGIIAQYDPRLQTDPFAQCQYDDLLKTTENIIRIYQMQVASLDNLYAERPNWVQMLVDLNNARRDEDIWFQRVQSTVLNLRMDTRGGGMEGLDEGGGGMGGLRPSGGAAGAGQQRVNVMVLDSSGFPGMAPGTRGGMSGGMDDLEDGGGGLRGGRPGGMRTAGAGGPMDTQNTETNGLTIDGFAKDQNVVIRFRDQLQGSGAFVKVYLQERDVNPVDVRALGADPMGRVAPATVVGAEYIVSFRMHVQFMGKALEPGLVAEQPGSGAPTFGAPPMTGGALPGMGLNADDDEDGDTAAPRPFGGRMPTGLDDEE